MTRTVLLLAALAIPCLVAGEIPTAIKLEEIPTAPLDAAIFLQAGENTISAAAVDRVESTFLTQRRQVNPKFQLDPEMRRSMRREIAVQLLENNLLEKYAKENQLELPKERIETKIAEAKAQLRQAGKTYEQMLADSAQSDEEFRRFWGAKWGIAEKLESTLTETEIDRFYAEHKDDDLVLRRAAAVVVMYRGAENVPVSIQRTKDEAVTRAKEAHEKILSGMSISEAVRNYSDAPSRIQQGDLGYFSRQGGPLPGAVTNAVYALEKVGDVSAPVESTQGVFVVKVTDIRTQEKLKEELRRATLAAKFQKVVNQFMHAPIRQAVFNKKYETDR